MVTVQSRYHLNEADYSNRQKYVQQMYRSSQKIQIEKPQTETRRRQQRLRKGLSVPGLTFTMDSITKSIDNAVASNDYSGLASVFSPSNLTAFGQGEQRALAGHFVKKAVEAPGFFPKAFASGSVMHVLTMTLKNLPSVVENAADNQLRQMLFDYKVNEEEDYSGAARILGGMRMESTPKSPYYKTAAEMCDGEWLRARQWNECQQRRAPFPTVVSLIVVLSIFVLDCHALSQIRVYHPHTHKIQKILLFHLLLGVEND